MLLIAVAVGKIVGATGAATILNERDPILGIPNRTLMGVVAVLELAIGALCIFGRDRQLQGVVLIWFGTVLAIYRAGLWWMDYAKPCTCLGAIGEALSLSDLAADIILRSVLVAMVVAGILACWTSVAARRGEVAH